VEEKLDADPYRHGGSEDGVTGCSRARLAQGESVPRVLASCLCWRGLSGQRWSGGDRVKRPTRWLRSRSAATQSRRLGALAGHVLGGLSDWLPAAQTPPSLSVSLCPTTRSRRPALPFPRPSSSLSRRPWPAAAEPPPSCHSVRLAVCPHPNASRLSHHPERYPAACDSAPAPLGLRQIAPCLILCTMYIQTTASGPGATHPTIDR
jgi:hypothetical protein